MKRQLSIEVDGKRLKVPDGITVKGAPEMTGHEVTKYPEKGSLFAPCKVGGCWSCAVEIDEEIRPACVTPVTDGLRIRTHLADDR